MKGDSLVGEVTYGIFRTPDEFVKEAMKVRRPFDARLVFLFSLMFYQI